MEPLQAGAVMAHELMHCWLAFNVLNEREREDMLPPEVEEGLCELVAYLWLLHVQRTTTMSIRGGNPGAELFRMENNDERHQGLSFHRAFRSLQGRTLAQFLSHVCTEGGFPPLTSATNSN